MKADFVKQLLSLENTMQVRRAMMMRRDEILQAIADKAVEPSKELVDELGELNVAIGDAGMDQDVNHGSE
jgi:hypothetical protein